MAAERSANTGSSGSTSIAGTADSPAANLANAAPKTRSRKATPKAKSARGSADSTAIDDVVGNILPMSNFAETLVAAIIGPFEALRSVRAGSSASEREPLPPVDEKSSVGASVGD